MYTYIYMYIHSIQLYIYIHIYIYILYLYIYICTHARAQGLCSEDPIANNASAMSQCHTKGITPGTQVESNTNIITFASAVHIVPLPNRVFSQQSHCSGLVDIRGSPLKVAQGIHSRHLGGKQCQHQHICVHCTHRAFA